MATLDRAEHEPRVAHGLEHPRLVGARLKSGGPRIAIDRAGALGRRRVDGEIVKERHLVHAVEQHDPAKCQVELASVPDDGAARNQLAKAVIDLPTDLAHLAVAPDALI